MSEWDYHFNQRQQVSSQNSEFGFHGFSGVADLSKSPPYLDLQNELNTSPTPIPFSSVFQSESNQYAPPYDIGEQHILEAGRFASNVHIPKFPNSYGDKSMHMEQVGKPSSSDHLKSVAPIENDELLCIGQATPHIPSPSLLTNLSSQASSEAHNSSDKIPSSISNLPQLQKPPILYSSFSSPTNTGPRQIKLQSSISTSHLSQNYHRNGTNIVKDSEPAVKSHETIPTNLIEPIADSEQENSCEFSPSHVESSQSYLPFLEKTTKLNYEIFLVKVLKSCHHVSMPDLYNLLYNDTYPNSTHITGPDTKNSTSLILKHRELKVCHRIVKTLKRSPCSSPTKHGHTPSPSVSFVNFHELRRNLMAMKIILDNIIEGPHTPRIEISLSSVSVYKVYYICCQKLIAEYPSIPNALSMQQTIILSPARLGKITRLVFPNLSMKRLGRRGQSKHHYMGLRWNKAIVEPETLKMLELDIPTISEYFKGYKATRLSSRSDLKEDMEKHEESIPRPHFTSVYQSPAKSFVGLNSRFHSVNCSPRLWEQSSNCIPQQSKWASEAIYRSVKILQSHSVDLNPMIQNFNICLSSGTNPNDLSSNVVQALKTLTTASAATETYLHLYLAIILLLLPVIIASDNELASPLKSQLRSTLRNCIDRIAAEIVPSVSINLEIFTSILERMMKLNEMTSVRTQCLSPESVLKEIAKDVRYSGDSQQIQDNSLSSIEQSYLRVVIMTFKAYEFNDSVKSEEKSRLNDTVAISSIVQDLVASVTLFADRMQSISSCGESDGVRKVASDISYQVFMIGIEILHTTSLINPLIGGLPIPIVNSIMAETVRQVHNFSFEQFTKRESELSQEVFKSLWIFATMFQEYLGVISEVVALRHHLY